MVMGVKSKPPNVLGVHLRAPKATVWCNALFGGLVRDHLSQNTASRQRTIGLLP